MHDVVSISISLMIMFCYTEIVSPSESITPSPSSTSETNLIHCSYCTLKIAKVEGTYFERALTLWFMITSIPEIIINSIS